MPRPTRPEIHIRRLLSGQHDDASKSAFLEYAMFAETHLAELQVLVRDHRTDPRYRAEFSLPSDEQLGNYIADIAALRARAETAKAPLPVTMPSQGDPTSVVASKAPSLPVTVDSSPSTVRQRRSRPAKAGTTSHTHENKNEGQSLSTTEQLAHEEKKRDELAAEMVALAGTLKAGAQKTHAALIQEKPVLDKLDAHTETSIEKVRRETARIQAQLGRSWSFTLCLWALMAVTMLLFFWTYFFMRAFRKR